MGPADVDVSYQAVSCLWEQKSAVANGYKVDRGANPEVDVSDDDKVRAALPIP